MEFFTDVELDGTKYQIGRLKARAGSWTLAQLLTKLMPAVVEQAFQIDGATLSAGRTEISEAEFFNLQGHALSVVRRYEHGQPMPIFVQPDTFVITELEYDLPTVMVLTVHSLVFNLTPFFRDGGLVRIMQALRGVLPERPTSSDTPTSTPSPSAP